MKRTEIFLDGAGQVRKPHASAASAYAGPFRGFCRPTPAEGRAALGGCSHPCLSLRKIRTVTEDEFDLQAKCKMPFDSAI